MTDTDQTVELQDVMICYATPDRAWIRPVRAASRTSVRDLVDQSGFFAEHPDVLPERVTYGVFGKPLSPDAPVGQGARIEIYRPLTFDPKESRRRRAAHRAALKKRSR